MNKCKVEDCFKDNSKGGKGYCGMHWQRLKRGGDINYICPESVRRERMRNSQPNLGKCKKTTYKKLCGKHEHRVVAERVLGRKLESWEHVHHIDGNKHNNAPENLTVMTRVMHLRSHGANFSREQILEIRKSKLTQRKIAELYKVSQSLISLIKQGKHYAEVKDD
jgi:predicted XRE-type DNA-binding protein